MSLPVATYALPDSRYAVLLNANAGQVSERLFQALRQATGQPRRVALTHSLEHARLVLRRWLHEGVQAIFAGGGDGTIVGVVNALRGLVGVDDAMPAVGVLRLGTGNALARWLGNRHPIEDLRRWQGGQIHRLISAPFIESEGDATPFAGAGVDAAILNDYEALRSRGWRLLQGMTGYLCAGLCRTLPAWLRRPRTPVEVINLGAAAWRMDGRGQPVGPPIARGEVLFRGTATMVGAATTPLYGYGLRMFPHATRRPDRFMLRLIDTPPLLSLALLARAWHADVSHPHIHDFYAERVRIRFQEEVPYQCAGDARGYRQELTFGLTERPVHLIASPA